MTSIHEHLTPGAIIPDRGALAGEDPAPYRVDPPARPPQVPRISLLEQLHGWYLERATHLHALSIVAPHGAEQAGAILAARVCESVVRALVRECAQIDDEARGIPAPPPCQCQALRRDLRGAVKEAQRWHLEYLGQGTLPLDPSAAA